MPVKERPRVHRGRSRPSEGRVDYRIVAAQNAPPFFSKYCWW